MSPVASGWRVHNWPKCVDADPHLSTFAQVRVPRLADLLATESSLSINSNALILGMPGA